MESVTKNTKTRPQIEAMAARAFPGTTLADGDDAMRELKDGWFNAAYMIRLADGREVILKIAPPLGADVLSYEANIMATEVASMRLVRQNTAIPVPEIYFFDDAHDLCDADYFFMEKVDGDNLEHAKASLPAETLAALEHETGAIIRAVNGFTGSYFGYEGNSQLRAPTWHDAFLAIFDSVLADGAPVTPDEIEEIREIAEEFTHEINWQDGDIAFLDNTRVMHGRRAIADANRNLFIGMGQI